MILMQAARTKPHNPQGEAPFFSTYHAPVGTTLDMTWLLACLIFISGKPTTHHQPVMHNQGKEHGTSLHNDRQGKSGTNRSYYFAMDPVNFCPSKVISGSICSHYQHSTQEYLT